MKIELEEYQIEMLEEIICLRIEYLRSEGKTYKDSAHVVYFVDTQIAHFKHILKELSHGRRTDGANATNDNNT